MLRWVVGQMGCGPAGRVSLTSCGFCEVLDNNATIFAFGQRTPLRSTVQAAAEHMGTARWGGYIWQKNSPQTQVGIRLHTRKTGSAPSLPPPLPCF